MLNFPDYSDVITTIQPWACLFFLGQPFKSKKDIPLAFRRTFICEFVVNCIFKASIAKSAKNKMSVSHGLE